MPIKTKVKAGALVANRKRRSNMKTSLKSAGCTTGMSLSVVLLGGVCFAQPAVTLSVESGTPTTRLQISGSGFPASTAVAIYFDTTELALTTTGSTGAFSGIEIQVPASALPGRPDPATRQPTLGLGN